MVQIVKKPAGSFHVSSASQLAAKMHSNVFGAAGSPSGYSEPKAAAKPLLGEDTSVMIAAPSPQEHLHYGGSLNTKTGAQGPKPHIGRQFRHQKRLELIVRMENAGLPESAIGAMLGISVNRIRHIKKSTDYLAARMKITVGLIVDQEGSLADIREQRKEMLVQMLPAALQVIANAVNAPALSLGERRFQHDVARDILDREGTFAKVQRSEITTTPTFDWSLHEQVSTEIFAVAAAAPKEIEDSMKTVERVSATQKIIDAFRASTSLKDREAREAKEEELLDD